RLIQSRATHLDQLSDKLKEPRVHSVISRILSTEEEESEGLKVTTRPLHASQAARHRDTDRLTA
ncbi:MAG: hypothetical protein VBE63_27285, partial [Lamprobacter sp.]|uniref:hypothetical protein n=1 Tax=Lamprobacter sp. TaxID=3100796 RepID=UPI002B2584E4